MLKRSAFAIVLMLILMSTTAFAQVGNQGALEGTIADSSGAMVAGAALTLTNQETGASFTTTSSDEGFYNFPVVPVGNYTLKVERSGFAAVTRKDVNIKVGSKLNLPLALGVSGTQETVEVTSEAPLVETTRTQVSNTVDEDSVTNLPVNGRNFIDFVLLTPGVTRDVRTGDISFGGQRGTLNSLTVDGADNNNTFFGQTTGRTGSGRAPYQFSQDAVQEFQVNSNGYSAELGRAGGAVINVITKSGTNDFHGTIFEFYRDRGLNADDPINKQNAGLRGTAVPRKPAYHFHQFGGNIGGPIVRNRAFFFFDYDGQRNTQPNTVILTLPVIAAPTAQQSTAIAYLQARSNSWNRTLNQDTYLAKADWLLTQRNNLSVRYNRQGFTGEGFENGGPTNTEEHTGAAIVKTDTISASLTSTLSATMINVARFSYQRDKEPGQANSNLPEASARQSGLVLLTVGRNFFSPRETTITRQQYADTFTYVAGRHTFKGGFDIIRDNILNFFPGNFSGSYTFTSLQSFGCSLQGVVPGSSAACPVVAGDQFVQAFAGTGTTGATTRPDIFETGFFLQDDWRVLPNLTLNLGVRYDRQNSAKPPVNNPVAAAAGIATDSLSTDGNNIGPRIGFAWTPWADSPIVFRGGYGIFFGRTPSIMVGTAHSNNGINVQTQTFTGANIPTYPNTKCGAPVDSPSCAAPTGGTSSPPSIYVFQPNYQQPRVQQANFGWEWGVTKNMNLNLGYQFVKGDSLQRSRDINLGTPAPFVVPVQGGTPVTVNRYPTTRPIAAFARITQFESSASSQYHGLTAQFNRRMANRFQFTTAYTWSHVIDDVPDATSVVPFGADDAKMVYDPLNVGLDRANGVNDQRHRFVASTIWNLSYANGMNPFAKAILGGWEMSAIFTAQSGQPYTGLINTDLNRDSNSRTERIPTAARNSFTLPATFSLDPRITKNIHFTERVKLQLLAEAFNVLNRFNVSSVVATQYTFTGGQLVPQTAAPTLPVNRFGVPNGHSGARIVQLGAKFVF